VGVDLIAIPGLHASTVHTMLSEMGLDLRKWPYAKAFCSWLGPAPHREISGGNILRRSTLSVYEIHGCTRTGWPALLPR
jgi:transposase